VSRAEAFRCLPRAFPIPAAAPVSWGGHAVCTSSGSGMPHGGRMSAPSAAQTEHEKVSRAVGDPGRGGDDRGTPDRARRSRSADRPGGSPLTVEQLLARQGVDTGRRRAARRADDSRPTASSRPAGVRNGLPPVPGADPGAPDGPVRPVDAPVRRSGFPPVPAGARPAPVDAAPASAPPAPAGRPPAADPTPLPPHPSLPLTELPYPSIRSTRKTGPVPPLPGRAPAAPAERRRPAKPERSPGRTRLLRAGVALAAVVGVLALYNLGLYFYVDRSIGRVDALAADGAEVIAPELQAAAETYLIVGTGVPGQEGAGSVTAMLASVARGAERAVLLSLPPTAMVDTPQCRTPDGGLRDPRTEAFAGALLDGGPSCLVRTVQQLSGLQVDHYLALDLGRLPGMVEALGDVPVCVPGTPAATAASEPLPAGNSTLTSDEVAGWLRPAEGAPDPTGAAVSERTQLLLTSTLRAALTAGTLADPVTLTRFLSRASDALTVDEQTTLGDLRELASALGDLSGSAVHRAELPVTDAAYVPEGSETGYAVLDAEATSTLFETVIRDTRVPQAVLTAQAQAAAAAAQAAGESGAGEPAPAEDAGPAPLTVPPSDITLDVLNATGTTGLAATVATDLEAQGFGVGEIGNDEASVEQSVVRHGPAMAEQARTVAAAVPGAVTRVNERIGDRVQLVIGPGYAKIVPVQVPPPAPAEPSPAAGEQSPAAVPNAAAAPSCS
jgi:LCP family protein required for cell wall assembly